MQENRFNLKIGFCSYEAAKYAVMNWHYSKKMPVGKTVKIGVWENDLFIGTIIFSNCVGSRTAESLGFSNQELCELVRVALKAHLTHVSKILSISIKLLKKRCPGLLCILSFADPAKNHIGSIYQANNWIYIGKSCRSVKYVLKTGKVIHGRVASKNNKHFGRRCKDIDLSCSKKIIEQSKYKYIFPLNKKVRKLMLSKSLPYPKRTPK